MSLGTQETPELVRRCREMARGIPDERLLDEYFRLLDEIRKTSAVGDDRRLTALCMRCLPMIEALIGWDHATSRLPELQTRCIPAIDELVRLWRKERNRTQLALLRDFVYYIPDLVWWRETVDTAERAIAFRPRVEEYFRERGHCLRKDLTKALADVEPRLLDCIIDDLLDLGVLAERKQGRFRDIFLRHPAGWLHRWFGASGPWHHR